MNYESNTIIYQISNQYYVRKIYLKKSSIQKLDKWKYPVVFYIFAEAKNQYEYGTRTIKR